MRRARFCGERELEGGFDVAEGDVQVGEADGSIMTAPSSSVMRS